MKNKNTIENKFKSWGDSEKKLPLHNEVLKSEIISKIPMDLNKIFYPKRSPFVWLPFAFTAMAVVVFFVNIFGYSNNIGKQSVVQSDGQTESSSVLNLSKPTSSIMPSLYERENASITDKREFLKVDYNATIRTRHVADLKTRIETTVRGLGGRIDSSNSGDKNGYINFVIPKENLESLKLEIKNLVSERFYNEQISSQNLLRDKQIIEENQKQIEKKLSDSQNTRAQIIGNHNQIIASYQGEILSKNSEINALNLQYQFSATMNKAEILNRINQLRAEISVIQSEIENENKIYQEKIGNINLQIKNKQEEMKVVKSQDNNLLENVATVNGSIYLNWISVWGIVDAYLPGPILAWILILAAVITFLWHRYFSRASYNTLY